jgi:hypothetical protein
MLLNYVENEQPILKLSSVRDNFHYANSKLNQQNTFQTKGPAARHCQYN